MGTAKNETMKAWLTNDYTSPEELHAAGGLNLLGLVHLSSHDMTDSGWVHVGNATVSLELFPIDGMVEKKVEALKAERDKAIADHFVKINRLNEKINNLLAITCVPDQPA